jgi:tagaturonate epimerase
MVVLEQKYLQRWEDTPEGVGFTEPGRQILHCTFGSVLVDETLGAAVRNVLESHLDTYTEVLALHFQKHLEALNRGL